MSESDQVDTALNNAFDAEWEKREVEDREFTRAQVEHNQRMDGLTYAVHVREAESHERHATAVEDLANNQRHLFLTLNDVLSVATSFAAEFLAAYKDRTEAMREVAHLRSQDDQDYNRIIEAQG